MLGDTKIIVVREQTKSSSSSDSIYASPISPQTPQRLTIKHLSITKLQQFEYIDSKKLEELAIVTNEPLNLDGTVSPTIAETADIPEISEMRNRNHQHNDQHSTNSNRNDNNSEKIIFNNVSRVKKVDLPDLPLSSRTSELRAREYYFLILKFTGSG